MSWREISFRVQSFEGRNCQDGSEERLGGRFDPTNPEKSIRLVRQADTRVLFHTRGYTGFRVGRSRQRSPRDAQHPGAVFDPRK
jgi:hypothetical protein